MKEKRKEGLSRIVFFFTIYGVIREVLLHYNNPSDIDMKTILCYSGITLMGVFLYGICAYISNFLSHTAAYDLLYEIRVQLMEKIAFVFQESMIFNDTVENNIRMGKKSRRTKPSVLNRSHSAMGKRTC